MKHAYVHLLFLLSLCFSPLSFSATPDLADANRLLDFAETAEPTLFFPTVETLQIEGAGSAWFYRYYSGTDSYVAINIDGTGPYFGGDVYVLGGQFGEVPLYVNSLDSLLATIDGIEPLPSGGVNAITNQGNGNCVARRFAVVNDTASIRTTTFSGDTSVVTDRTEFYEEVTDTKTTTVIEQTLSVAGSQTVTSNRYTSYFESQNGLFFNSENDSEISISATGLPPSSQSANTTYAPSLFIGPADLLCEGQEWFAAPVTQTTINNPDLQGNGPVVSQTPPTVGTINSIGEIVTVQGSEFSTIKMTLTYPQGRSIIWTDTEFGVIVRSETYLGDSENPSSVEVLTQLDLPF